MHAETYRETSGNKLTWQRRASVYRCHYQYTYYKFPYVILFYTHLQFYKTQLCIFIYLLRKFKKNLV